MTRIQHRQRKPTTVRKARLLSLLGFRYSTTRDAYVLRVIGNHVGPVYQIETSQLSLTSVPVESAADTEHAEVR